MNSLLETRPPPQPSPLVLPLRRARLHPLAQAEPSATGLRAPGVRKTGLGGAWVAQRAKHPTLGFGSGHDLTVHEFEPHGGLCADSGEPAWDSFHPSLSLSAPPWLVLSISLKINKHLQK